MEEIDRFQVIEGGKSAVCNKPEAERVTCKVCEVHDGIDTAEYIPVYGALYREGDKLVAPVDARMACFNCMLKGRKTYTT